MSTSTVPPSLAQASFPGEIVDVVRRLKGAGYAAYLVGGVVRDTLLGRPGVDYDVATSARAQEVIRLFRKVIPTGIEHGTVTVLTRSSKAEVTTFRGEGAYHDGRRPESVVFLDDIVQDLARRDFTINAMAYDPTTSELVDPFGGADDLAAKLVRCVGAARERFSEDGLRPLRAVRFASVLNFTIDPATQDAIPATLATFAKVARERVREELSKMLVGPCPGRGVGLLRETALLPSILPELSSATPGEIDRFTCTLARVDASFPDIAVRLAALLWDVPPCAAEAAVERLRYPRGVIDTVKALLVAKSFALDPYADDAALRRAMSRVGRKLLPQLLQLGAAQAKALGEPEAEALVRHNAADIERLLVAHPPLSPGELAIDGRAVMRILEVGPGPHVGEALRFLLEQALEDPGRNTPEIMASILRSWRGLGG